jgi:hypothetical protein
MAEIYVFSLAENGQLPKSSLLILRSMGTSANRVGDLHKGIVVADLLMQYRRAYLTVKAEYPHLAKPPSKAVKEAFAVINTIGQNNYAGVIKPLAKTHNDELWNVFSALFRNNIEVNGEQRNAAKSTAPFLGMSSKWGNVHISDSRKIVVLKKFGEGDIKVSQMAHLWHNEFNKALFINYVNSQLKTSFPLDAFERALAVIAPLRQSLVLSCICSGSRIKTRANAPCKMPPPVVEAVAEAKKNYKGSSKAPVSYSKKNLKFSESCRSGCHPETHQSCNKPVRRWKALGPGMLERLHPCFGS